MTESVRFGSKAHRDFIKDYRRQQKIYTPEQCIQELIDFMKKVVKGEPIAEKIAMESIVRCDSREGMLTNRHFFKDYLEAIAEDNPGHNPGKTVAEILSGRTDYRAKQQAEMLAKDKLSMDNFDMTYEQLPDVRKSLVDLAYLRDLKAESNG